MPRRAKRWTEGQLTLFGPEAPPPKLRLTAPKPLESDVQKAIIAALIIHPRVAFVGRYNSGAWQPEKKDGSKGYYRFVTLYSRFALDYLREFYNRSDWLTKARLAHSDLAGMLRGGRAFYFEVKRPGEKPRNNQQAFLNLMGAEGALVGSVCSVDEALMLVETG